jgi:hemerythrin
VGGAREELQAVFASIRTSLSNSYAAEEELMERHGYPFRQLHSRQHHLQMETMETLAEEILSGEHSTAYNRFAIMRHLVDRYINHTTRSDYHLGHFLNRNGVS